MWRATDSHNFPTRAIIGTASLVQEVGNSECPNAGWLLAYRSEFIAGPQRLDIEIAVAGPGPEGLNAILIDNWEPSSIGQVYIPWPKVTVTVTGTNVGTQNWRANYMPVQSSAEAAGLPSILDRMAPLNIAAAAEATLAVPNQASQWCVWPNSATTLRIQPQAASGTVRGQWDVGGAAVVTAGQLTPQAWRRSFPGLQVRIVNSGAAQYRGCMFLRYDFRNLSDP